MAAKLRILLTEDISSFSIILETDIPLSSTILPPNGIVVSVTCWVSVMVHCYWNWLTTKGQ